VAVKSATAESTIQRRRRAASVAAKSQDCRNHSLRITLGFAGITCASAALSDAAENNLAGRAPPMEVDRALNGLLERIGAH